MANDSSSGTKRKHDADDEDLLINDLNDINVKSFTGKTLSLQVKGSDTLGNLKRMIRDKESIPISEQALIYKEMVLEGIIILADFGIKKGSTLKLMRKSRGGSMMRIFVKTPRGRLIPLQVKLSDTIRDVKSQIKDDWEYIPLDEQELIFKEMVLDDKSILSDFHINNDSTLTLMRKSRGRLMMRIFVKTPRGRLIPLQVKLSDTIRDVKSQIKDDWEYIPLDEQELIFKEMVLDDKSILADFHINNDSTLTLLCISGGLMQIFVKTLNGVTISLRVKPSNTIADVKAYITLENDISLYNYQVLTFKETVLEDSGTLFDFHIKKGSTLTATGLIKIFVKSLTGEIFSVECKRTDSVWIVKEKIHDQEGITPNRQRLLFRMRQLGMRQLEDHFTLADHDIYNGSIIYLVFR